MKRPEVLEGNRQTNGSEPGSTHHNKVSIFHFWAAAFSFLYMQFLTALSVEEV